MTTLYSSSPLNNGPQGETAREMGNQGSPDMGNSGPFRGELGEATAVAYRGWSECPLSAQSGQSIGESRIGKGERKTRSICCWLVRNAFPRPNKSHAAIC